MSKKLRYKTIQKDSDVLLIEKKSKFIGNAFPVDNEIRAIELLNTVKSNYPDATHHVYAYIIDENNIFRYSDDGEPSGTAGMPVLDVMRRENIVDALVVVTRYFGGTLLGTGGLVHAYSACARDAVSASGIVTRCMCNIIEVQVNYSLAGKVQNVAVSQRYIIENIVYGEDVKLYICCVLEKTADFISKITDITNGNSKCGVVDTKYIDLQI